MLVVYKKSLYELYKDSPDEVVQNYLKNNDLRVLRMIKSHDINNKSLDFLQSILTDYGVSYDFIYRADLAKCQDIDKRQLVIAAGGDGTLIEVARNLSDGKLLGYITDTLYSTGFFCSANQDNIKSVIQNIDNVFVTKQKRFDVVKNGYTLTTMLNDVCIDDENSSSRSLWELQDLGLIGGSGILVSSAVGSTAWIYQDGGNIMSVDDERLQYKVRSNRSFVPCYADKLKVISHTRKGNISIDGEHNRFPCTLGDVIEVLPSSKTLNIIGDMALLRQKWEERFQKAN